MIPEARLHTDAVIALLAGIGVDVGDNDAAGFAPPFVVVYRGPGRLDGITLDAPNDDGRFVFQVSCVGETREAADGLADAVRALVLSTGPTVAGRYLPRIEHENTRGAYRDVQAGEKWFTAVEEFRIWTTPGNEAGS